MNTILKDPAADRYVTAIEENLSAWIPVFGKLGQVYENNPVGVMKNNDRISRLGI
ncbi:MAG: hypothetical protein QME21_06815 [Anaerolineales bacterium]|nr:hypothetical protein [Anaerolineales bacterium]